ncbi:MAG: class I SAM-dependent methyltransferase [Nanoarchaeota archaeon]|nr:class I SAM-dependent methyltransferase [Nanoarchaeota archaeon]
MNKGYFSSRYAYDPRRSTIWRTICKFLQKYIPGNSVILDLGCGYGDFINNIKAGKKYAVDISPSSKKHIKKDVVFSQANSTNLKYKKNSFDTVFCSNLFEHLNRENLNKTISEIKRVLKPNASLLIIQPNYKYSIKDYFDDYTHELVFTHISLKNFLEANDFEVKQCKKRLLPFSVSSSTLIPAFILPFLLKLYLISPIRPLAKQMFIVAMNKK